MLDDKMSFLFGTMAQTNYYQLNNGVTTLAIKVSNLI